MFRYAVVPKLYCSSSGCVTKSKDSNEYRLIEGFFEFRDGKLYEYKGDVHKDENFKRTEIDSIKCIYDEWLSVGENSTME